VPGEKLAPLKLLTEFFYCEDYKICLLFFDGDESRRFE